MDYLTKTIIVISILLAACSGNNKSVPEITTEDLTSHITYLASEELQGRLPGSDGDMAATEYFRDQLASFGFTPVTGDGFQEFEVAANVVAGDNNSMEINGTPFTEGADFAPVGFSGDGFAESEVIFAGYGFDFQHDEITWNDYSDIDVEGKWVLILRADPEVENSMSLFTDFSANRYKCMVAADKGAAGVLLVSGVKYDSGDQFEKLSRGEFPVPVPVLRVKRELTNTILEKSGFTVEELEEKLNSSRMPVSFNTETVLKASADIDQEMITTRNVIMQLKGENPALAGEYVIVGAHIDHLGTGGASSRRPDSVAVHYGADDNASGIAAILEIAEYIATQKKNSRTIIVAAFAAEEMGLLGSKYMADNLPVTPLSVNAMINLDMVGRLKESRELQAGGAGTSPSFREIIYRNIDTLSFALAITDEGYGPSDHSSFYGKDIPVLYFSTGAHPDYHTPYDSPDKINYRGLEEISTSLAGLIIDLAGTGDKLAFTEAGPKQGVSRGTRMKGVTLGIMPDFAGNVKNGLRADFVTPDRPAALGGMINGDIIKSINGMKINNIEDYMFRLSSLENGETITVEVERNGENLVLLVTL
ncbi:MAG: M20/M25/M40 family metallo-hydrolase [Bacteroidales bacterium]|nr:M20/M25/M40 family metallo-hydrolase [Bacteroidales bacterium]